MFTPTLLLEVINWKRTKRTRARVIKWIVLYTHVLDTDLCAFPDSLDGLLLSVFYPWHSTCTLSLSNTECRQNSTSQSFLSKHPDTLNDTTGQWVTLGLLETGNRSECGRYIPTSFSPPGTPSWWGPSLQPLWEAPDAKRTCLSSDLLYLFAACPEVVASMATHHRALLPVLLAFSSHGLDPGPPSK